VAAGAAALALIVLGTVMPGFVRAMLAPSAETQSNAAGDEENAKKYAERFAGYLAQVDGRSLFLVPGPPVKDVSTEPPPEHEGESEKPKPSSYGGPAMVAMMNDAVWFDNGKRLKAGGERDGDLRVVSVNIPWEATLEWQEVEFKVGLFTRDALVIKSEKSGSPAEPPPASSGDVGDPPEADAAKPPEGSAAKVDGTPPGEIKPNDAKPNDVKPAEAKPADVKPPGSSSPAPPSSPPPATPTPPGS
jgi:hypothetical protein